MEARFEFREGRVWVQAQISGHRANGIFDTGSDGTAIDSQFARSCGLTGTGRQSASTVAGKVEVEKVGRVDFDVSGQVLSSSETNALPLSAQIKGLQFILGFDAMLDSPFVLWPRRRRITFGSFGGPRDYPFLLEGDIRPTVRMQILGDSSHAFLDTGSAQGVSLPRKWVEANANRLGVTSKAEGSKEILGNEVRSFKFDVKEVVLGDCRLRGVPAEAVQSDEGSFADQSGLWGNVGNLVIQRFESMGFDGRRRRLTLGEGEDHRRKNPE